MRFGITHLRGFLDQRVHGPIVGGIHARPIAPEIAERSRCAIIAGVGGFAVPFRRLEPIAFDAGANLVQVAKLLLRGDVSFFRQRAIERNRDCKIAPRHGRVGIQERIGAGRPGRRRDQDHERGDQHRADLQLREARHSRPPLVTPVRRFLRPQPKRSL